MKKIYFVHILVFIILTTGFQLQANHNHNEIAQELGHLRRTEYRFKQNVWPGAQEGFRELDKIKHLENKSWWQKILYPDTLCRVFDLVMLTQEMAPKTYALVQEIAEKMDMPMPAIYVMRNKHFYNAFASGWLHTMSVVAFGEKLVQATNLEELKFVIAHELTHVKERHVLKKISLNLVTSGLSCYILHKIGWPSIEFGTPYENKDAWFTYDVHNNFGSFNTKINIGKHVNSTLHHIPLMAVSTITSLVGGLYSRMCEYESDAGAAKVVGIEGGIGFLEHTKTHYEYNFDQDYEALEKIAILNPSHKSLEKIKYWWYKNSPFRSHPTCDARIEALKQLAE